MPHARRSRHVGWVGNLALVAASMAVLFTVAEIVTAFLLPAPIVWRYPQERYVDDPQLLHRLQPNQQTFTHAYPVVTNELGLRNEPLAPRPRPGTTRVLCLGDSLTFGNGVAFEDTYPRQLEVLLNASGSGHYEVVNAGVPAYDTWQEVTYLRNEGMALRPALVIIGFYANDIVARPRRTTSPRGARAANRTAVAPRSDWADRAVRHFKRSRLLLLMRQRVAQLKNQLRPSPDVIRNMSLLQGTTNEVAEKGWEDVEASFAELAYLATEHRFDVLVVFFPMPDQLLTAYPDATYPSRGRTIAARHGLPAIDLLPAFEREFSGFGSLFIEWDGHPNARAFAIAAKEIADHVISMRKGGD